MSESGTMARVESMADSFERVLAKLDRLDERMGDLRVDIVALRNAIDNVRALVDGAHTRVSKLEADHAEVATRLRALEDAAAEQRGAQGKRAAVTTAAAVGGGGAVAALAEVIRSIVGMP